MPLSRVAPIGLLFWSLKILSTGAGETGADFLDHTYSPLLIVAVSFLALVVSLVIQLKATKFSSVKYWTAIVMVSIFGTLAADAVHVVFGIPYWVSTLAFTLALVSVFIVWHRTEKTLEMANINTFRRELFYWTTVMVTFALGTAAGDWMAMDLHLGFLTGALVFTLLFVIPLVFSSVGVQTTITFWLAYTFTRPMGASFADWLALPPARGGLGFGTLPVTLAWLGLILLVAVFSFKRLTPIGSTNNK